MLDRCIKCGVCCRLIPVDWENRVILRDGLQLLDEEFEELLMPVSINSALQMNEKYVNEVLKINSNAQFFCCKFISDNNECTNDNKHQYCNVFPTSPFACLPEDCSYSGEIFLKKEAIKQKIRRLKEEIIDYEAQIATTKDKSEREHLKKIIVYHQKFIGKYKAYGSRNW